MVLPGSKNTTKVLIILIVLKSSVVTERFRFCFATRFHFREYKDRLKAYVSTLIMWHMDTLMGREGDENGVW